jgi:aminoglycoside phosphotransferase
MLKYILTKEDFYMSEQAPALEAAVQGLLSQLDASKQMYNESINTMFQLRTQAIQLDKMNKDLQNQVKQLKEELEKLRNPQSADVAPDPQV